jgi:hypothetical protein
MSAAKSTNAAGGLRCETVQVFGKSDIKKRNSRQDAKTPSE